MSDEMPMEGEAPDAQDFMAAREDVTCFRLSLTEAGVCLRHALTHEPPISVAEECRMGLHYIERALGWATIEATVLENEIAAHLEDEEEDEATEYE